MDAIWNKTAVRCAVFVLLAALGAQAGEPGENWAQQLFTERSHDFGPVPRGGVVRHNFVLVNRSQQPLTILDVRASCGCTTGRASATQIAPGASAVVEAQMDTRNFVGIKATTLTKFINGTIIIIIIIVIIANRISWKIYIISGTIIRC